MLQLLWLVPALPLAGFVALAVSGGRLGARAIAWIGAGSVGLSALVALGIAAAFLSAPPPGDAYAQVLWHWIEVGGFSARAILYLDPLALVMMLVVTFVGFLIHLYSVEFMGGDEGYNRYFAYMNLFVAAMLVLVLAGDLAFLFVGWEGVGLCSYLLIGYWYRDPVNGAAAQKAFIVTRTGDAAMVVGLFLLFAALGTLDIQPLAARAAAAWSPGAGLATAAAALLLCGALGKSAQLPLQTWLPDAMAGPTPVSALIHAATMVTAGVYLIARTHVLFVLAPAVLLAVAIVGAATLLVAGTAALAQHDIKRVLAWSTVSQIGYMFLALGVGAWSAAIFHFMIHAFFKALLFLAAGVVIHALDDEHDIFKMGGLRRRLPLAFWTFLIGGASLSALPVVTAGYYSKDLIIASAWTSAEGSAWLWAAAWVGAVLTGLYTFRLVFHVFFGAARTQVGRRAGWRIGLPLVVLALLSVVGGFVLTPHFLGDFTPFARFLEAALPPTRIARAGPGTEVWLAATGMVASFGGIAAAYVLFLRRRDLVDALVRLRIAAALERFLAAGWAFDWLYDRLLVRPFLASAWRNRGDIVDRGYDALALASALVHRALSRTQNGRVRWYAAGVATGGVLLVAMGVWL